MKEDVKKRIKATFDKLREDPSLIRIAEHELELYKKDGYLSERYIKMWEIMLKLPLEDIEQMMLSEGEIGEDLRSTSVFVRVLWDLKNLLRFR